jgi:hypothetical protein
MPTLHDCSPCQLGEGNVDDVCSSLGISNWQSQSTANLQQRMPAQALAKCTPFCRWFQDAEASKPVRQVFDDLWALDLRTWMWSELPMAPLGHSGAPKPQARSACGMAWFEDFLLVYGGKSGAAEGNAYLGDLWSYHKPMATWCARHAMQHTTVCVSWWNARLSLPFGGIVTTVLQDLFWELGPGAGARCCSVSVLTEQGSAPASRWPDKGLEQDCYDVRPKCLGSNGPSTAPGPPDPTLIDFDAGIPHTRQTS